MANVNKKKAVKQATGMPSKEQVMTSPFNRDTLSASIQSPDGTESPAALTEGEFVFSLPAIIALGEGDYDTGLQTLTGIHEELKAAGKGMLGEEEQQNPLAAIPPPSPQG